MQAEEESEAEDFSAAADHGAGDFGGAQVLANELVGDQGEGNSGEKKKEGRGQRAEELRSFEEARVAGIATQPGVVTVRLEHQDAGQAAHPVDPGETGRRGRVHMRECNVRAVVGPR